MTDDMFLFQFENCTLLKENFKHQGHLRIAWLYLRAYPFEEALIKTTEGILRFATSLGAKHIYHETLTRVWVHLVYHAMRDDDSFHFNEFIAKNPSLLDKNLPLKYYSHVRLFSDEARYHWLLPNLKVL